MHSLIPDLVVFLVYMTGILLLGSSFYRKSRNSSQFTRGGGKLPAWVVGMSIFATYVSSISFLALPGKAYQADWNAFVFSLSIPVAAFLAVRFFVPLYRSINSISAYTYLEVRFGPWARKYASLCYVLTQLMRTGSILYLMALPLNALSGWNIGLIIIVTGLCVIVYSMLGGIQGVIWTDAVQGMVLIGGALTCAVFLVFSMPDGAGQIYRIALDNHKLSLGDFRFDFSGSTFWIMLLYGLFINIQNYGVDQNYVQRYMTTGSDREARKSAWFGSLLYIPVSWLFFFIGTALFAYYKVNPGLLPADLTIPSAADKVFPYYIVHGLPSGITGLLIASVFAAGMSTVSTSINGTATILLVDNFSRKPSLPNPEKYSMRILYLGSLVFGILGTGIALAMINVKSALDTWWNLASIFSGGMLGLFLLGFISRKVSGISAAIATLCGILVIIWLSLSPVYFNSINLLRFRSPFHANLTIVIGTTVIFLTGFFISTLFPAKNSQK